MFNILNNTTFFNFLPSPPSIIIGLFRPFLTVFLFSCTFFLIFWHMPPFLFMASCPRVYSVPCYSTLLPCRGNFSMFFYTPPLSTLQLDALTLHIVFWHLHCFAVSYPACGYFLLELVSECLMHHASKCIPYLLQSLCIHWLHIVHQIILPVHDITSNLGFFIFPKCDACEFPSYRVIFPHILANILLSCFPRPIPLRNKVWNILQELCHKFYDHWMAVFLVLCLPSLPL